ncbi:MAG: hypothetical protein EBR82_41245 [Caulobacteraceae bacterium]|nr:hypothetical protein [Caulobacteraceae bacterium]
MAGDTSRIDIETLRVQWASHSSYAAICAFWTVTRDQLVRLRDVLPLPLRHDRRLRFRPPRAEKPTPQEIAASEASLDLAPWVAARATCVSAHWTDEVRAARQVAKPEMFQMRPVEMPEELRNTFDDLNRECQW